MKRIVFGLLIWGASQLAVAQSPFGSNLHHYGLSGSVRTLTQTANTPRFVAEGVTGGSTHLLSNYNYEVSFNVQGRAIEVSDADMLGGSTSVTAFSYNRKGSKLEGTTVYNYNSQGELLNTQLNSFSPDGRLLEQKHCLYAVAMWKKNYYYNDDNRLIRVRHRSLPLLGLGGNYYEIEYNEAGLPCTISHYKKRGKLKGRYTYQYNDKGEVNQVAVYNSKMQEVGISSYQYNEQGDVVMAQSYQDNHKGLELLNSLLGYRPLPSYLQHKSGNYSFQYQYDEMGNWTQCMVSYGVQPLVVLARDITYF